MYRPQPFDMSDELEIRRLIRVYPLGALVVPDKNQALSANHIPLIFGSDHLIASKPAPDEAMYGRTALTADTLQGHVPRANKLWEFQNPEAEVLAIFQGVQGYISPNWYPSKHDSGRVVPTWNYEVVYIRGRLRVVDDASWILRQMATMTQLAEKDFTVPWQVTDAPADYIRKLTDALLGIEIQITHVEAKSKMSQNQPQANRAGVLAGLVESGTPAGAMLAKAIHRKG